MSSAEAELYGIIRGAVNGTGLLSIARDLGETLRLEVLTDSSAAVGVCRRKGIGKVRHLNTNLLWIQDKVRDGSLILRKVLGTENSADLLTKHLTNAVMVDHLSRLGLSFEQGRSDLAPRLSAVLWCYRGRTMYCLRPTASSVG